MNTHPTCPQELWERTPSAVRAYMATLEARHASMGVLEARVATLAAMVHALPAQLDQTSRHSSRPPSSAPPELPRSPRPAGTRRRGGQPGHPGSTRPLRSGDEVDELVVLKPQQCPGCHAPVAGDAPAPWRHQVLETPPLPPVVTAYQWHPLVCPACGVVPRAPWPAGGPSGPAGPRLPATVAVCTGVSHLSQRMTQPLLEEVCGIPVSVGTISPREQATTAACAAPVEAARPYVHQQAVARLEETRGREGNKPAWLWMAVPPGVTGGVVRLSRGGQVARELVGEPFAGMLGTERSRAYHGYAVRWRPLGGAPLRRDVAAIRDRGGASAERGEALLAQAHQRLPWWHRVREGT